MDLTWQNTSALERFHLEASFLEDRTYAATAFERKRENYREILEYGCRARLIFPWQHQDDNVT